MSHDSLRVRSTTVLLVRRGEQVALAGDGQVTMGETVMKSSAKKVRRIYNDRILVGFAGATADAFSLLTRFEGKLEQYHGNLERAAIELSKDWRTDKILRNLEALLVVADDKSSFLLSGNGDVITPDKGLRRASSQRPLRAPCAHQQIREMVIYLQGEVDDALRLDEMTPRQIVTE